MFGAWGLVSRNTPASGTVWYAFDERGNVAQRVGGNGALLSTDLYDAFGNKRAGPADVFGFGGQAGYYTDAETGLVLCTNRHYDPQSGRFLTRDPLGYGGGINLYSYTANNPVNGMDPLGLDPGYWQSAGQFGLGEVKGIGNFVAGMTAGSVFDLATGGRYQHPFGGGSSEAEQNGAGFGGTLALAGSFFTGQGEAAVAENGLRVLSGAGEQSSAMVLERTIQHGEKVSDLINEMKVGTYLTGNEYAVVKLGSGERAIVSGGPGGITFAGGTVSKIYAHTHPTSAPPSAADFDALRLLGQPSMHVFHGGQVTKICNH